MADPSKEVELSDFDGHDLPLSSEIPTPFRQVIDLTIDDNDNGDGDGDEVAEVRRFRNGRPARCYVRLILPSLIDGLDVVDQLPLASIVLLAEMFCKERRWSYNVMHGGYTWRQEIPLEEYSSLVLVA